MRRLLAFLIVVIACPAVPASAQGSMIGLSPVAADFDSSTQNQKAAEQKPAAEQSKPAEGQTPPASGTPAPPPPVNDNYNYEPAGRRDPFLSLLNSGADPTARSGRAEGVASMTVGEVSLRGVLQTKGELIAMIKGPDNKTYLVHKGDKLLDGTIQNITPQGLVILQEVNDPLSLVKQREVRKMLRSGEDVKE